MNKLRGMRAGGGGDRVKNMVRLVLFVFCVNAVVNILVP
jgi:hypothetical protein